MCPFIIIPFNKSIESKDLHIGHSSLLDNMLLIDVSSSFRIVPHFLHKYCSIF